MSNTKIVILGGGFGGVAAALGMEKKFRANRGVKITLIDREPYQLFNSNLYEVAAAAEELESVKDLKKSIGVPFAEIFKKRQVEFIQGEVRSVDAGSRTVGLSNKAINYDYLVLALGSCEECFNIPGAGEYGTPLKSLGNALKIKNAVEFAVQVHKYDAQKKYVRKIGR